MGGKNRRRKDPRPLPEGVEVIDSHCHLADEAFDEDRAEVWQRARDLGVRFAVVIGAGGGSATNDAALELARRHPEEMRAVVGIHPHDAKDATPEELDRLATTASDSLIVGVGETGLDYHYDNSTPEQQHESLRAHVRLARDVGKPLVIHCRDAYRDLVQILAEEGARDVGGVIHCFTGNTDEARSAMDLGFSISVSGIVTFKNAEALREAAREIPLDRLLVETDCPFLAPVPLRGRRCEPGYVVETVAQLAELRGETVEDVCEATCRNTKDAFRLPVRP